MLKKIFTAAALLLSINAFAGNGTAGVANDSPLSNFIVTNSEKNNYSIVFACTNTQSGEWAPIGTVDKINNKFTITADVLNQNNCGEGTTVTLVFYIPALNDIEIGRITYSLSSPFGLTNIKNEDSSPGLVGKLGAMSIDIQN